MKFTELPYLIGLGKNELISMRSKFRPYGIRFSSYAINYSAP